MYEKDKVLNKCQLLAIRFHLGSFSSVGQRTQFYSYIYNVGIHIVTRVFNRHRRVHLCRAVAFDIRRRPIPFLANLYCRLRLVDVGRRTNPVRELLNSIRVNLACEGNMTTWLLASRPCSSITIGCGGGGLIGNIKETKIFKRSKR